MLRIHLTDRDVAATCTATGPSPAIELSASVRLVQSPSAPPRFAAWRQAARTRPTPGGELLRELVPAHGYGVTFLSPLPDARRAADTVDAFAATPAEEIRTDVQGLARRQRPVSPTARALADGQPAATEAVGAAIHHHYLNAIAPVWDAIRRAVDLDLARRARIMLHGGVDALLATLGPGIRWRFPVLEVDLFSGLTFDLRLGGRGLLLQPSVFAHTGPVIWDYCSPRPTLVYPVATADPAGPPRKPLADLLGHTRAAILGAIVDAAGSTTTELARGLAISPAAVSQHTAVLRRAGLIDTLRHGKAVLHTATPRAAALLDRG